MEGLFPAESGDNPLGFTGLLSPPQSSGPCGAGKVGSATGSVSFALSIPLVSNGVRQQGRPQVNASRSYPRWLAPSGRCLL